MGKAEGFAGGENVENLGGGGRVVWRGIFEGLKVRFIGVDCGVF